MDDPERQRQKLHENSFGPSGPLTFPLSPGGPRARKTFWLRRDPILITAHSSFPEQKLKQEEEEEDPSREKGEDQLSHHQSPVIKFVPE